MRKVGCKGIRFRIIHRFKHRYPLGALCDLLEVSRGGYYKWLKRQGQPNQDEPIADLIRECQKKVHGTYGYRRVKIWLFREFGLIMNHKAVLRITRKYGLQAAPKKKRFRHYNCDTYRHYENVLNRDFKALAPNQKWATDISYIATQQGFLYLSVIKDLYDNSILAHQYGTDMSAKLVINTVKAAVKKAKPSSELLLHSDNGFQYASQAYFNITKANRIRPSMSRVGCPYDNACVESFFSLLKNECIYKMPKGTIEETKELIDEYIHFYNNERIQLSLQCTPFEYRARA